MSLIAGIDLGTTNSLIGVMEAGFPILVSGAKGHVTFEVGGESIELVPGTAVHVEAGIMHRLVALEDSVVTLVVLR